MPTASAPLATPQTPTVPRSIRLLRRCNPLVVRLLESPLHGLLSRDLLVLHYRGRRSGIDRTLPLSYTALGGHLYLCTRNSRWPANLDGATPVTVRLRGRLRPATATRLDPRSDEARAALAAFLGRNPRTGEGLYDVRRAGSGRADAADVAREVLRSQVVRLTLDPGAGA